LRARTGQVTCAATQGKGRAVVRHGRIPQRAPFAVRGQRYSEKTTQPTISVSGEGM
jgi:hypothetical protein